VIYATGALQKNQRNKKKACGVFTAGLLNSRATEQDDIKSCLAGIEEHSFVPPPCI